MESQPVVHREELLRRLMKALEYLPHETQMLIVASFIPLNDLERIVKFQEEETLDDFPLRQPALRLK